MSVPSSSTSGGCYMTEFACPECGEPIYIVEVNSKSYKQRYRIVCGECKFFDWVSELEEIQ